MNTIDNDLHTKHSISQNFESGDTGCLFVKCTKGNIEKIDEFLLLAFWDVRVRPKGIDDELSSAFLRDCIVSKVEFTIGKLFDFSQCVGIIVGKYVICAEGLKILGILLGRGRDDGESRKFSELNDYCSN